MREEKNKWIDPRIIQKDLLKDLDKKNLLTPSPEPKQGSKGGDASKDGGDGYDGGETPR